MGQGAAVLKRAYAPAAPESSSSSDGGPPPPGGGAEGSGGDGAGSARIKCQNCGLIWQVACGTTAFVCSSCGARVLVALAAVSELASQQVGHHLAAARRDLTAILEEQVAVTQSLWDEVEEELGLAQAMLESQPDSGAGETTAPHALMLLREATSARDIAQVQEALAHANEVGLAPPSEDFAAKLERLHREEDLEVLWRCFLRALAAEDAIDLDVWSQEAEAQQLQVPATVRSAVRAMRGAEKARMAELDYSAGLGGRAEQLLGLGDAEGLERLVREAVLLGADASAAEAALASLRADGKAPSGTGGGAIHGPEVRAAPSSGAAEPDIAMLSANELRQLSVARLKAELSRYDIDLGGLCEKDEMIHILLVTIASRREADKAAAEAEAAKAASPKAASATSETPRRRSGGADAAGGSGPPSPIDRVQGMWYRSNGASMQIVGSTIRFFDGTSATLTASGDKLAAHVEGQTFHGSLAGDRLAWSDGDVWTRTPPPTQQKPKPKRPQAERQKPPPPRPPKVQGGAMTFKRALDCLGLPQEPTEEELRKAYKRAAMRWHPDRRQNHDCADEAKEKFQEVRAAFEYLQDCIR